MAGVTSAGFDRKLEADILAELVAEARATVDPEFDDSPDSATGQLTGIVGSKLSECWEVLEAVYNALSVHASGVNLDRIAAITGTIRKANETDAQLRVRRRVELADAGQTTEASIRAALSKIDGVSACRVVSNRGLATDLVSGRPGKSVECIVVGGTDAAVAQVVWDNLPAGIESYGTTPTAVTDEQGNQQVVKFSRATAAMVYVRISAEVAEASYAGHPIVKQTIADFTSGELTLELSNGNAIGGTIDIGAPLYRSRLAAAALTVPGVVAVTQVAFSSSATGPWFDVDHVQLPRQFLGLSADARGFDVAHVIVVTT
jgi:hypothetical protein